MDQYYGSGYESQWGPNYGKKGTFHGHPVKFSKVKIEVNAVEE